MLFQNYSGNHLVKILGDYMPLIHNPNDTFPVRIKYRDILNEDGKVVGAKVLRDEEEGDDIQVFEVQAIGRVSEYFSRLVENSYIINHVTGLPLCRMRLFCDGVFRDFFRKWNLVDAETGEMIPMSDQMIMWFDYGVKRAAVRKWLKITGGWV